MKSNFRRTPKNYTGTQLTTHKLGDVLSTVMSKMNVAYQEHPEIILGAWPEIIGPRLAAMTQAVSFYQGFLTIKVKNSLCCELLNRDKQKIYVAIRQKFPQANIKNINFRIA